MGKFSFKRVEDFHKASDKAVYQRLFEIGKRLLAESEVNKLLTIAMDYAIEISRAERGMIILFDGEGNTLFQTARNLKKQDIDHPEFEISRTIIDKVKAQGTPTCLRNALDDPALRKSNSVERLKILSVICLPLNYEGKVFGVVYLDNRTVRGVFKSETCTFIQEFANFISLAAYNALERKQLHNRVHVLEQELRGKYEFESIVGHHPKMLEILELVSQIADTDATVLIQGESGTGKELIARALHFNSSRKDKSFIPINCAALPEHLLESELFGHVRGAFTGAIKDKVGWFERAAAGTIFLDEVNDMSPALQARLLRVLQTGEYSRVGSTVIRHCDVRIVAATSKDLHEVVKQGKFREEVYYRLNVFDMWLPPLRERKSDIPLLVQHFLKMYGLKHGKEDLRLTGEVESLLLTYDFPGNVRELENIMQHAVILACGPIIEPHHLPTNIFSTEHAPPRTETPPTLTKAKRHAAEKAEKEIIIECLKATSGHISKAAKVAGIHVSSFHKIMTKHGIDAIAFKKPR